MLIDTFEELLGNGMSAENALKELKRQLKWQKKQLIMNERNLNFRNKSIYAFFLLLLITMTFSFLGIYTYNSNNILFSLIFLIILIGNGYIYSVFSSAYIEKIKNDIKTNKDKIKNLNMQINIALTYINKKDYTK